MKKIDVVLGLQWGDEGKGKVVDEVLETSESASNRGCYREKRFYFDRHGLY